MEGIVGDNLLLNYDHEPLVTGGDSRSVNFLTFTLLFSAYRPVPLVPFAVLGVAKPRRRKTRSSTSDLPPVYA